MYRLVIDKVHLSVSQRFKVCGVLMAMILDTCTLSILVYNLFLDRQRNISIHRYIDCHHRTYICVENDFMPSVTTLYIGIIHVCVYVYIYV